MSTTVRIEADSCTPGMSRLTTFVLRYPRIIHAELLTHRLFSRNSSSSRAMPTQKLLDSDFFVPKKFSRNGKGMQSVGDLDEAAQNFATEEWKWCARHVKNVVSKLLQAGVHKEHANRLLEPFTYIDVIVTSTERGLKNFFELRCHKDAQPEIQELAHMMKEAYDNSIPKQLAYGQWHSPFHESLKRSVAACARVSYSNHDGTATSNTQDEGLFARLLESKHLSPFEHQARTPIWVSDMDDDYVDRTDERDYRSNFDGWVQLRKLLESGKSIDHIVG